MKTMVPDSMRLDEDHLDVDTALPLTDADQGLGKDTRLNGTTALDDDWKGFNRILHQFGDRWREAGHLGEKAFAEMQPLWKAAIAKAAAPLEALQAESMALRHAMIEEAKMLGAAAELRIDAVKALQQRWQAVAHRVPMDRRTSEADLARVQVKGAGGQQVPLAELGTWTKGRVDQMIYHKNLQRVAYVFAGTACRPSPPTRTRRAGDSCDRSSG